MKHALDLFSLLLDQFDYTVDSFLRLDISKGAKEEAVYVIGAASFLLDKMFAKEDAVQPSHPLLGLGNHWGNSQCDSYDFSKACGLEPNLLLLTKI